MSDEETNVVDTDEDMEDVSQENVNPGYDLDMAGDLDESQTLRKVVYSDSQWQLTIDGDKVPFLGLSGIVLAVMPYRACYAGDYVPGEQPDVECASIDGVQGFKEDGTTRQCRRCPNNVFGSGRARGKRCKEYRVLFCYMEVDGNNETVILQVPPSKLGEWRAIRREFKKAKLPIPGGHIELSSGGFTIEPGSGPLSRALADMARDAVDNKASLALLPGAEVDDGVPF